MFKVRNNTVQAKQKQLKSIHIEINTQTSILDQYLKASQPTRQYQDDLKWMNKYNENFKNKIIINHDKKLRTLKAEQQIVISKNNKSKITSDTTNVINMSKVHFSQQHLNVLSKGLKFVPTPRVINTITTIVNCEKSLYSTPMLIKNAAISEISTFIHKWKKPRRVNMNKEEIKMLNEIKLIEDIVIVQADKGGKIVIMDKTDYMSKIEEKLNDIDVYEEIKKDPTTNIKTEISQKVTKLLTQNKITEKTKYYLTSIDDLPKIRGQPKLHKNNTPMRIVTCSRDTITSPLSQFTFNIIRELRTTLSGVLCNTSSFVKNITNIKLDQGDYLASLDIQDLYTNIPVTKAIDITLERLIKSNKLDTLPFTKTDIKDLLNLCLKNSYFQFNGKFYKQKTGLPMGNTLSPILADIYMDDYQQQHLQKVNIPNKIWRYVDDILIITKMNESQLKTYLNKINKKRGTIKFTSEFEQNNKLNFLDTTLTKLNKNNETTINIRWFRKETAADRLLNYESSHGRSIKLNIVKNMTTRILETTQDDNDQKEDLNKLKTMLLKSNYPLKEIEKLMEQACKEFKSNKNKNINNDNNNTTSNDINDKEEMKYSLSLPYVPGMEILKRKFEKNLKIKLYFSYPYKLQSHFNRSLKIPSKSVIYQIPCSCKQTYVGQTKVGIDNRMKQHSKTINDNENNSKSEMVKHFQEQKFQCIFDTNDAFIIDEEKDYWKRRTKEAIYSIISKSINTHDEINPAWTPILYKTKEQIERKIQSSFIRPINFFYPMDLNQPICPTNYLWTMWFNEAKPASPIIGDLEDMSIILAKNPTKLCSAPYSIHAQSINSPTQVASGQWLLSRPSNTVFLMSYQSLIPVGIDFRVRYCCPMGSFVPPTIPAVTPLPLDSATCGKQEIAPRAKGISRIFGGTTAIPNSWPWMLFYQEKRMLGLIYGVCGATLISQDYAITSAQCLGTSNAADITLIAGMHNKLATNEGATQQWRTAKAITVHPQYDPVIFANDIAVIRLNESFVFNKYVQPACLPGGEPQPDEDVVTVGWGSQTLGGVLNNVLQQTYLKVTGDCERWWSQMDNSRQICAADMTNSSSICSGDAGGPLLAKYQGQYVVSGLTSYVRDCKTGAGNSPNVYTRLANYKAWIKSITG